MLKKSTTGRRNSALIILSISFLLLFLSPITTILPSQSVLATLDSDGDGINDDVDQCPNEPETYNGIEDTDGCPDGVIEDTDGDGINDDVDQCPNEPETYNGIEDTDGCPDGATPVEVIEEIVSNVENLQNIPQSTKTSLTATLKGVVKILSDDNPNNDNSACGKFGAFTNKIKPSEKRGSLTEDQAEDLRTQSQDIRDKLNC